MNNEARVIYNSIVNDTKLLPLSSFKSTKFSKYNIFPHAQSLPAFFDYNLQNQGRIVKFLKGPQAVLRGFYYQLFKLAFEMQNNYNYPTIIKNLVFSPVLIFQSQPTPQPKSQSYSQYKRIIAQFITLLQSQVIPNAQLTFSQYPIIDEAMLVILQLVLHKLQQSGRISQNRNNMEVLCALCQIFRIKYQIYQNCFSFEDSDVFLYVQSEDVCYLAFLSQMAQVQSYEKSSQSPHQNQFTSNNDNGTSNSYIQPHYGYGSQHNQIQRDIRLSAGNRGSKTKIMNKSSHNSHSNSAGRNHFGSSSFGGGRSHKVIGDYQDRQSPQQVRQSRSNKQSANQDKQMKQVSQQSIQQYEHDNEHEQQRSSSQSLSNETEGQRVQRQINNLRNQYSNLKSHNSEEDILNNSGQVHTGVEKNVFDDLDTPQRIVSKNSISAHENSHQRQHMHQYFVQSSATKLPVQNQPAYQSEQQSSASHPMLPILSQSSMNILPQPVIPNYSHPYPQPLSSSLSPVVPQNSNSNIKPSRTHSPKSIYQVHTYKSIDSVQQSKYSKVDSNYDNAAMLGNIGEYMLMKKKQHNNAVQYANVRKSRKTQIISNLSQIIKQQINNNHKQKHNQHQQRARGRSQVKLQDKVFQYQFKSHKYRNYSTHNPSPQKLASQYYPSQLSSQPFSTAKDISNSLSQQNRSSSAIPTLSTQNPMTTITAQSPSNFNVNLHVNLHLNLSNIGDLGWKGDAHPTMETSKDRENRHKHGYTDDGSTRKSEFNSNKKQRQRTNNEQIIIHNENLERTMQKTIQKTIDKTLDRIQKHVETEHMPSLSQSSKQAVSVYENQLLPQQQQQKQKSKFSQQDVQFNFYNPTIKINQNNNNSKALLLPDIMKKHDENVLKGQNIINKIITKQGLGLNADIGYKQKQKFVANSVNNLNSKNNDDTLGTFYRQFSDTKVMEAMIEPFKTKVRATRHKFKGIRSKNFKGFA